MFPFSLFSTGHAKFDFFHQFVLLRLRRSLRPQRSSWRTSNRVLGNSCTRGSCRELKPGGTGCVLDLKSSCFPISQTPPFLTGFASVLSLQLEQWWLDTAYLEGRSPSQLSVNFAGPAPYLEHSWPPAEGTDLERASIFSWHMLQYWNSIRT